MFSRIQRVSNLARRAVVLNQQRQQIQINSAVRVASSSTKNPTSSTSANTQNNNKSFSEMTNAELLDLIDNRLLPVHQLEKELEDPVRAVDVRRDYVQRNLNIEGHGDNVLKNLPQGAFDFNEFYSSIDGTNCENVVGFVPVPVGVVGPLLLDNEPVRIPMATTEGALVASTNRGCRAIAQSGGAFSVITQNGMTRAPLIRCPSVAEAAALKAWVDNPTNNATLKAAFNSTTRFGRVRDIDVRIAGRNAYVRFACQCGDAMGMNMVTKGSVAALKVLTEQFPEMDVISLSGNVCSDKKAAAINWIQGRGRSVAVEVFIPGHVVTKTLKTSVDRLLEVNINKNLVGSAMAGSIGGFNAHASNIVAAVFLATGNDIAQNVESANCITLVEKHGDGIHVSVTMPSIEVGTVGGGTSLPAQKAALAMMGCAGAHPEQPGANADKLARAVAATVLAGELSLLSALASGHLLESHLRLNRKKETPAATSTPSPQGSNSSSKPSTDSKRTFATFGHPSSGGPSVMPVVEDALSASREQAHIAGAHASRVSPSTLVQPRTEDWYGEDFAPGCHLP